MTVQYHFFGNSSRAAMRLWLGVGPRSNFLDVSVANYSTPVGIGEVMRSFSVGKVVASRHPNYGEGDAVMGMLGWQEYAISDGSTITTSIIATEISIESSPGDSPAACNWRSEQAVHALAQKRMAAFQTA